MNGIEILLTAICINSTCDNAVPIQGNFMNITTLNTLELNLKEERFKAETLANLTKEISGTVLKIGFLEDYPLSYSEIDKDGKKIGLGVAFQLLSFLTKKFNFTYEMIAPESNIVGSSESDDYEGSLIQLLNTSKADMAAAFIPILNDARKFITYSATTLDEGEWYMIMLRPAESATGSGLTAPFDTPVWLLIFVSLVSVGPIIYLLIIIRHKMTKDSEQINYPLPHCVWFVYGALMKQGSTLSPVADSTRLLFATWWMFITILTSFYTANLTAFLTLSKFTLPINSADDILKKEKTFVTTRGGGVEYAIKNNDESLTMLSKLVQKKIGLFDINNNDTEILIDYVEKKNFVFIRDRPALNHLIYDDYKYRKKSNIYDEKAQCPFAISKTQFLKRKRAFAFSQNSKWAALFDPELLHLVESGIVKYMLLENLPNAEICPQNLAGTERQLKNGDLLMTYYIMLTGFCTAFVVFASEIFFKFINFKNSKKIVENKNRKIGKITNMLQSPPPPYASLFQRNANNPFLSGDSKEKNYKREHINGREYYVVKSNEGENRLIPVRAPSATLFQYSYTN